VAVDEAVCSCYYPMESLVEVSTEIVHFYRCLNPRCYNFGEILEVRMTNRHKSIKFLTSNQTQEVELVLKMSKEMNQRYSKTVI